MIVHPLVCRAFIGRREEMEYLQARRREAAASHGGLILVSGEAGLGKSRLLAEFSLSLANSRWRIGTAQCLEFAQRPYGPILDVLERLEPLSAAAPAASKAEHFERFVEAFARVTARNGLVLLIEDLHWADAATIELLVYLSGRLETMRMLVVATVRLDEFRADQAGAANLAKLARMPRSARIALTPLDGLDLRAFIDQTLDGIALPGATKREIARASDGNPFFVEELLKAAVENGSAPAVARPPGLPITVRATLLERMRHLDAAERQILVHAAAIGRTFGLGLLGETLGRDVDSLLPALQRARNLQLVEEESPTVFRFRHALTREAIYGEYLGAQLQPLHRTIAQALERSAGDDGAFASLAYHWWNAGELARATAYYERAGDEATLAHAHEDAIAFYERAIEPAATPLAVKGRIVGKIGERRLAGGFIDEARSALLAAAEIFRALHDTDQEARYRIAAAKQSYHLGSADPAGDLQLFLARLDAGDRVARNRVHLAIAQIMAVQYLPLETQTHIDRVERRELESDPELSATYRWVRAAMCVMTGDAAGYRAEHRARLSATHGGAISDESPAHVRSSAVYQFALLGLPEESLHEAREAIVSARLERNRRVESVAQAFAAFTYVIVGDLAGARDAVDAVRSLPTDNLIANGHAAAWGTLTGAYCGDEELIGYWFDRLESTINPTAALLYAPGYAEVMVRRGRTVDAQALLHRAIESAGCARGIFFTLLAVARHGHPADFAAARASLEGASAAASDTVERHALPLFDALVAGREGRHADAVLSARAAIEGLARLRYPLLEAAAREISGDPSGAAALYRRAGATYELHRLEGSDPTLVAAGHDAPARDTELSPREREIAMLVARGQSNLEIGRSLSISHKTVEKHLGAAFSKLGFKSRSQLAAFISQTQAATPPVPRAGVE